MAKLKVFCVHDVKAGAYLPPFVMPTTPMAVRWFSDLVREPKHAFAMNPEDYTLFEIGEYDDMTGVITMRKDAQPLGRALDFVRS